MRMIDRKLLVSVIALATVGFGIRVAEAQFVAPTCVPPNCNPSVIQNIGLTGTTQTAGINISDSAKIGQTFLAGASAPTLTLATENLLYGNVSGASVNASLLLLQFGAADRMRITLAGQQQLPLGSVAAPSYSYIGDTNTGFYSGAADSMSFATNGVARTTISNSGTTINSGVMSLPTGSAAAPSLTFTGDTNTGIYRSAADTINFVTNGTTAMFISSTNTVVVPNTLQVNGAIASSGGLSGDGSGLTNLDASDITTGTLNDARLSTNVATYTGGGTYTGVNTFSNASNSFTGSGSGLTSLNATNVTSGTLADARLSTNVGLLNATQTWTGANTFSNAANSYTGVGTGLTALNATQLTSGTLPSARLSGTYSGALTFSGNNTYSGMSTFGSATRVIGVGQNLIYGNIDTTSTGSLLLLQNESVDRFRVDAAGNVTSFGGYTGTTGTFSGAITSGGVSVCLANGTGCPATLSGSGVLNYVVKFTPSGDQVGNSQILDDGTNVGIDNPTPAAKLHVTDGNVVFDGSTYQTPPSGAGTRFLWFPDMASIRAGEAYSTYWDEADIGWASAAFGERTRAAGDWSFATGWDTYALGTGSVAMGIDSEADASSYGATMFGYSRAINADWSFGVGAYNVLSADYAAAIGYNNTASAINAIAMGGTTTASGVASFAFGDCVTASQNVSIVFGRSSCGSQLNNNIARSFMIGFMSNIPTLTVRGREDWSAGPTLVKVTGQPHLNLTAATEAIDVDVALDRTVQWNVSALPTQRAMLVRAPTYSFTGASTITNAATFAVSGAPVAGTNATITNPYALWVQGGTTRLEGNLSIGGTISGGGLVTGSGTTNYIPKFTAASTIGNSTLQDSGTAITTSSSFDSSNHMALGSGLNATVSTGEIIKLGEDISGVLSSSRQLTGLASSIGSTATPGAFQATLVGTWSGVEHSAGAGGNLQYAYGVYGRASQASGQTMVNAYGVYGQIYKPGAGGITNAYGGYFQGHTSAVNNWALYTASGRVQIDNDTAANVPNYATGAGELYVVGDIEGDAGLDVDANTLYVDSTNDRVGLGLATPANRLDVSGAAAIGASYAGSVAPANGLVVQGALGVGTQAPGFNLDVNDNIFGGTSSIGRIIATGTGVANEASLYLVRGDQPNGTASVSYYTNTSWPFPTWQVGLRPGNANYHVYDYATSQDRLTIDTSGNVGLGTSSPIAGFKLTVFDDGTNGGIVIQGDGVGDNRIRFDNNTVTDGYIFQQASDGNRLVMEGETLGFNTSGANRRMVIDAAGNIGIGNTAPTYTLDVTGRGRFTSGIGTGGLNPSTSYGIQAQGTTMGGYMYDADGTSYTYLAYSGYGLYTPQAGYFGGKLGVGTASPYADYMALGNGLGHNKFTLYETSAAYSYGMGVVSGQFSLHVASNLARFAFYNDAAATTEIFTIYGSGEIYAPYNGWNGASGWILCGAGDCVCPSGYFVTNIWNKGDYIYCRGI